MPQRPVLPGPGRDGDPGQAEEDWLAWCEAAEAAGEPLDPDEEEPGGDAALWDADLDAIIAECREATAEEAALAARAARQGLSGGTPVADGRRGPGQPGSAQRRPGEFGSRAAGFGAGMLLDVMPGCGALAGFAAEAAGEDDRYEGACDDEVAGAIAAWDRVESYAAARKLAAVAEFIRRRPEPGSAVEGVAQMPESWDESITAEVAGVLAESRCAADGILDLAHDLEVKLPGTAAAFRDGILRQSKVAIIARATAVLDPAEARAAEQLVLDRVGRLTPGGLRAAIARAVMEVAPKKARKRREVAAKFARVERWAEDSGNAALAGRELPPDEVLAVDQRITWWAGELRQAGLAGDMDAIRARALLDLLLGQDSRPRQDGAAAPAASPAGATVPGGFAGRVTLTVPLTTAAGLTDRPGEIPGIGPIDPWLARDLAATAAANPKTTWCVTVTDEQGHAVGHGCARPEPKSHRKRAGPGARDGPGFYFAPTAEPGTWRLRVPGCGSALLVRFDPIDTRFRQTRWQAWAMVLLRVDARALVPRLRAELAALLTGLTGGDWALPTACPGWSVHDVAAHLLGVELGNVSVRRDRWGLGPAEGEDLDAWLNRFNQQWVDAARRISPALLIELIDLAGRRFEEHLATLDLDAAGGPVQWATGSDPAPVWLDVAREYMERYVHQQQIRDATGRPPLGAAFTGPVLETAAHALPRALDRVTRPAGTVVTFTAEGEGGGSWHVVRAAAGWELAPAPPARAAACQARTTVEGALKLYARDPSAPPLTWQGDREIAGALAGVKAVLG